MWRNWQTRMIQVHVGNRAGSSPVIRTKAATALLVATERETTSVSLFPLLPYACCLGEQMNRMLKLCSAPLRFAYSASPTQVLSSAPKRQLRF